MGHRLDAAGINRLHLLDQLEDAVTEADRRVAYLAVAPETEAGLYLVPKVIE